MATQHEAFMRDLARRADQDVTVIQHMLRVKLVPHLLELAFEAIGEKWPQITSTPGDRYEYVDSIAEVVTVFAGFMARDKVLGVLANGSWQSLSEEERHDAVTLILDHAQYGLRHLNLARNSRSALRSFERSLEAVEYSTLDQDSPAAKELLREISVLQEQINRWDFTHIDVEKLSQWVDLMGILLERSSELKSMSMSSRRSHREDNLMNMSRISKGAVGSIGVASYKRRLFENALAQLNIADNNLDEAGLRAKKRAISYIVTDVAVEAELPTKALEPNVREFLLKRSQTRTRMKSARLSLDASWAKTISRTLTIGNRQVTIERNSSNPDKGLFAEFLSALSLQKSFHEAGEPLDLRVNVRDQVLRAVMGSATKMDFERLGQIIKRMAEE